LFEGPAEQREQLLTAGSHELRTPPTPIVGLGQVLLRVRVVLDPDARLWVQAIDRNGRHLTELIDDLLLLSRASRDRLAVEPEVVELGRLATQVVDDQFEAPIVGGRIDGEVCAWADPQQVRQILDNLLQKALRHGNPTVGVDVERVEG